MSPARKGRRTTQRGSNRPSEASGSRLQRAQTLAEQILDLATGRDGGSWLLRLQQSVHLTP